MAIPPSNTPSLSENYPCNVCGNPGTGRFSPDLDIKGLVYCEKHKDEVQMVYVMLLQGSEDIARQGMKDWKIK